MKCTLLFKFEPYRVKSNIHQHMKSIPMGETKDKIFIINIISCLPVGHHQIRHILPRRTVVLSFKSCENIGTLFKEKNAERNDRSFGNSMDY